MIEEDFNARTAEFIATLKRISAAHAARRQAMRDLTDFLGAQADANPEARRLHALVLGMIEDEARQAELRQRERVTLGRGGE